MQLPVSGILCESGTLDATLAAVAAGAFAAGALTVFRLGFSSLLSFLDRLPVGSVSALLTCSKHTLVNFAVKAASAAHLGQQQLPLTHAA